MTGRAPTRAGAAPTRSPASKSATGRSPATVSDLFGTWAQARAEASR